MPKSNWFERKQDEATWPGRALVGGLVLLGALISCAGTQIPKDRISDPGQMLFNGQILSGIDCYRCHNGDGTGTWRGANLAQRVPKLSDVSIAKAINEGPGMMPSFKGKIDDQQIAAITAWLRGRFPEAKP
jgi:mono/diheme cytochrome c family protein